MQATGSKKPQTAYSSLYGLIWKTLFQRLWDTWNYILFHTPNRYKLAENDNLAGKLHWYRENRHHVLRAEDCHLAEHDSEAIERLGRLTKRKWIQQLDKLRNIYSKKGHLLDKGQAAITEHFTIVQSERPRRQKIAQRRITRKKGRQLTLNVTRTVRKKRKNIGELPTQNSPPRTTSRRHPGHVITPDTANKPTEGDLPRPPEGG
jgi:hypothetical protein